MAGGVPAIGCRGEPARRRSPRSARACASSRPADPEALAGGDRRARRRAGLAARARRRRRARRSRRTSRGSAAAAATVAAYEDALRMSGRLRAGEAGPLRHQPRARLPRRRVRGAARARGRRLRARRRRRAPRRRARRADAALPFPVAAPAQRGVARLAASGRFRAVVAGPVGPRRAARRLRRRPRRAGVPFVLWATIWRHPRTAAHALSYLPLRHLYRHADAIATYGPHVSAYVRAKGARGAGRRGAAERRRRVLVRAGRRRAALAPFQALFAGRLEGEKGLAVLLRRLARAPAAGGRERARPGRATARSEPGPSPPGALRPAGCPPRKSATSTRARTSWSCRRSPPATSSSRGGWWSTKPSTRESPSSPRPPSAPPPAGSSATSAPGSSSPPGDAAALAAALRRLRGDPELRARLGAAGRDGGRRGALPRRLGGRDARAPWPPPARERGC